MNESSRLSDRDVTDMLRRRSGRPVPAGLATVILQSLATERAGHPARTRGRSAKRPLILLAAAALLVGGGTLAAGSGALRAWSTVPPDPRSAFVGTWVSTSDADGGTQTMTVTPAAERSAAIVVTDTIATVCSGTSSTMTGTGTVGGDSLVIPTPDYRCDDGSEPEAIGGPPLEAQLRNLTYRRDAARDTLTAGTGIWLREGAAPPSDEPTASARSSLDADSTTENGQPISLSHTSDDGQVSVSAPSTTWDAWLPGKPEGVWFGGLWQGRGGLGDGEPSIGLVDPVAYDAWCAEAGGSPLLSAPADAASIAQQVIADPNFQATSPVAARVGGREALSMDVALAPGGRACGIWEIEISRWIHELQEHPELRMRLFLVDLPVGMSAKTLAITVKAPKDGFEAYLAEATPIIESIEFHPGAKSTSTSRTR